MKIAKLSLLLCLLTLATEGKAQFSVGYSLAGAIITGYNGPGGAVNIPGTINGSPVIEVGAYAFARITNVTSVTLSNGVISIDQCAFESCSLTNINLPSSVTTIGVEAFQDCSNLTAVAEASGLKSIGWFAFENCGALTTIHLPSGLTNLGDCAFLGSGLTNVTLPASLKNLGNSIFANCANLASVTIAEGVTNLTDSLFYGCALTSITIPNSVASIGSGTFANCEGLTNITIPGSVVSVGDSAFYDCTNVLAVSIADGVVNVGSDAFAGCAMTNMVIPASITNLNQSAFEYCFNLTSIAVDENNPVYSSDAGILFNKDRTILLLCPEAGPDNYTVPDQVTRIGDLAFEDCYFLTNLLFGKNVTSLGNFAFQWSALPSVTILAGITNIGSGPFAGCWNLTTIMVDGANPAYSSAGGVLFDRDQKLLVQYPCGVVGSYAVPDGVTSIGDNAFDFSNVTGVTLPNSTINIGTNAFGCCTALTNVTLNTNLLNIGDSAFFGCQALASIVIPNSVTNLGESAFSNCDALTNCVLGSHLTQIGASCFAFSTSLPMIAIPDSVTDIGDVAFFGCTSLSRITVGIGVTNIGVEVFSSCAITNIALPANLVGIGFDDFYGCSNLVGIYFAGNAPPPLFWGANNSYLLGTYATCYCLPGASGWKPYEDTYPFGLSAQVWDPQITPQVATFGMHSNRFSFTVTASTNLTVMVQECADLSNRDWQPLQTLTLTNCTAYFSDAQSSNAPSRFYRLSSP